MLIGPRAVIACAPVSCAALLSLLSAAMNRSGCVLGYNNESGQAAVAIVTSSLLFYLLMLRHHATVSLGKKDHSLT